MVKTRKLPAVLHSTAVWFSCTLTLFLNCTRTSEADFLQGHLSRVRVKGLDTPVICSIPQRTPRSAEKAMPSGSTTPLTSLMATKRATADPDFYRVSTDFFTRFPQTCELQIKYMCFELFLEERVRKEGARKLGTEEDKWSGGHMPSPCSVRQPRQK